MTKESEKQSSGTTRVTQHALDVLLKLEAEQLAELLPSRFGLALPPIRRSLPTEIPQLSLHLERLDQVFELEDDSILHLEFQAAIEQKDLRRFLRYGIALLEIYAGRTVRTVVFCGPRTATAPQAFRAGSLPYRFDAVLIGNYDGDAVLTRLRTCGDGTKPWTPEDRLDLLLLPLMHHTQTTEHVLREGVKLAETLPEEERPRILGSLLALVYHYCGKDLLQQMIEGLMSTHLWEQVLSESVQRGIQQGLQEGKKQGLQEGKKQGLQEGKEQGRAEGEREFLRYYLEQRFSSIPPHIASRMQHADATTLRLLFEHALKAATIEDL